MNSFEAFFARELQKRMEIQRKDALEALAKRVPYEEYLLRVGYLQALNWVLDECKEVEKLLKSPA